MLNEHTLDQLRGLRLDGMVHALARPGHQRRRRPRWPSTNAWRCSCSARSTGATASAWRGCSRPPAQGLQRLHRRHRLARLARPGPRTSSPRWPAATGCVTVTTCSSPGPPASARPGSPARWRSRLRALGFTVLYTRAPRLLEELRVAHGDGTFARRLAQLARIDLLALDDFAIAPITATERNDLLELLDDRVGSRATLITSQLPVTAWHDWLDDPDAGRRDPRSHRARRPQDRAQGRVDAKEAGQTMIASRTRHDCQDRSLAHGLPTAAGRSSQATPAAPWTSLPARNTTPSATR